MPDFGASDFAETCISLVYALVADDGWEPRSSQRLGHLGGSGCGAGIVVNAAISPLQRQVRRLRSR